MRLKTPVIILIALIILCLGCFMFSHINRDMNELNSDNLKNLDPFEGNWTRMLDEDGGNLTSNSVNVKLRISIDNNGYYLIEIKSEYKEYSPIYFGSGKYNATGNLLLSLGHTPPINLNRNTGLLEVPRYGYFGRDNR